MISRRTYVWSALALAAMLFFGLNIFADNFFTDTRLDLTQTGQYTISARHPRHHRQAARAGDAALLFFQEDAADYPATAAYAKRVRDLLGEYAALAMARSSWRMSIPSPSRRRKTKPVPRASGRRRPKAATSVYFGLEGDNSIDGKEAIPYFAASASPIWNTTSPR